MQDVNKKIQAASHSGAKLHVYQNANKYFVRKSINSAIEKNYDSILKQKEFKSIATPTYDILAIPVSDIKHTDIELSISMPFIEGIGGEQLAYRGSKIVAENLKIALDFYLIHGIAKSDDDIYLVEKIIKKIDSIYVMLDNRWSIFPSLKNDIHNLKSYCQRDLLLPLSSCHGDLTLSNIKITEKNQLVLFDFLSCEINSPLQDAAKIIQDFEYGWSFRKEKESIRIKGEIFCEYATPSFIKTLNRLYHYEMRVIEALTILRIAPYIRDNDSITISWFNEIMAKAMRKITG